MQVRGRPIQARVPVVSLLVGDPGYLLHNQAFLHLRSRGWIPVQDRFRKRIRLSDWDYAPSAISVVTICIADRTHRIGPISDASKMMLDDARRMVEQELVRTR